MCLVECEEEFTYGSSHTENIIELTIGSVKNGIFVTWHVTQQWELKPSPLLPEATFFADSYITLHSLFDF